LLQREIGKKTIEEMGRWKGIRTEKQDRRGGLIYGVEEQEEQTVMCFCYYGARLLPTRKCLLLVNPHAALNIFSFQTV